MAKTAPKDFDDCDGVCTSSPQHVQQIPRPCRFNKIAEALTSDDQFDHDSLHPPCPRESTQNVPENPAHGRGTLNEFKERRRQARSHGTRSTGQHSTHRSAPTNAIPTRPVIERGWFKGIGKFWVSLFCLELYIFLSMHGIWILAIQLCTLLGLVLWARLAHRH